MRLPRPALGRNWDRSGGGAVVGAGCEGEVGAALLAALLLLLLLLLQTSDSALDNNMQERLLTFDARTMKWLKARH